MLKPDTSFSKEALALGHMDRVAWRKVGCIPGWEPFAWEVIDHEADQRDVLVEGSIPRTLKTGKRKGAKTWRDDVQRRKTVVTDQEIAAEKAAYSAATGNCATCMGSGEVFSSWSATDGTKHKTCKKCEGTGKHHD